MLVPIISSYIINYKIQTHQKEQIFKEFAGRNEFNLIVVNAIQHEVSAIGLWQTIRHILKDLAGEKEEYILVCKDNHQFTPDYSLKVFFDCITEAKQKDADVLFGGISSYQTAIQVSENLFWIDKFSGLQFTIIFKKFYEKILNADFNAHDSAEQKIAELTDKKLVIFPFISTQKDFGYFDVTTKNDDMERVKKFFEKTSEQLKILEKVRKCYLPHFKKEYAT